MLRKMFMALMIVLLPMSVAGCSTIAAVTGQSSVATLDEKALLTAEIGFGAVVDTIMAADQNHMITPARAAQIIPLLREARTSLETARAAYDAGNAVDAARATNDATAQIGALVQLLVAAGIITRA